jgi:quercetin dioxygenase-like cupin family protein
MARRSGPLRIRNNGNRAGGTAMTRTAVLILSLSLASGTLVAQNGTVRPLLSKDLGGVSGKELTMITVEYPPGGSTPVHTHHAHALLYVLEGSIVMQVKGGEPVTLVAGQTWYEGPDDVHVVSRNASNSAPAKYLVVMEKDKGAPILTPVK